MTTTDISSHILTIDIEEHFQASRFDSPIRRRHWASFQSRVHASVERILELLARHSTKATFFALGWLAEQHPSLIRAVATAGHEVACLGYGHELVAAQTPDLFRNDIRRAKLLLEDLIGQPVWGFRAPSFSITPDIPWALPIVAEAGFLYDSSMLRIGLDSGDCRQEGERIHRLHLEYHDSLWEIPPSIFNMMGFRVPVGGGGYLRALSYPVLHALFSQIEGLGKPIVLYMRAWELDVDQPRMSGTLLAEFRHYLNLDKMESRLHHLLTDFHFGPVRDAVGPIRDRILPASTVGDASPTTSSSRALPAAV